MGKVVKIGENGEIIYIGMLSSHEKVAIDEIIATIQEEIPTIESELAEKYGKGVLYKYYLGKVLGEQLTRFNIKYSERPRFWKEIKHLASNENRKRDEGKNSSRRCFYEQCYVLSQQPLNTVNRLTWRQWQDLLDRDGNREDERIFKWLGSSEEKIREDDWREFEKALHLYLKDKDTSVFDDEELFAIYDSIMLMSVKWREQFKIFEQEHPKSAKIKTKGTWVKKYYARCFALKKEQRSKVVTEEMCNIAFAELMK